MSHASASAGAPPPGWYEVRAPDDIAGAGPDEGLWLRGAEAGGPIGDATALTLIRAATAAGRRWVAEGLGPAASAAALAVGAAGIVIGPAVWLGCQRNPRP